MNMHLAEVPAKVKQVCPPFSLLGKQFCCCLSGILVFSWVFYICSTFSISVFNVSRNHSHPQHQPTAICYMLNMINGRSFRTDCTVQHYFNISYISMCAHIAVQMNF